MPDSTSPATGTASSVQAQPRRLSNVLLVPKTKEIGTTKLITYAQQSSQSGTMFSSIMDQKRGQTDAHVQARKNSFADMKPQTGVIGNLWNS
ncbi:MAG: hypothetical protein M1814_004537 [Vezdaea aestivalis]|nr:MAG: hypothetical protein M1814_004537 [Vezdaea aestivalis]